MELPEENQIKMKIWSLQVTEVALSRTRALLQAFLEPRQVFREQILSACIGYLLTSDEELVVIVVDKQLE